MWAAGSAGCRRRSILAESDFKVYLVERGPSIGGVIAQLDKTFPTNDCAMCTMAPRLVEVARHPNIELLTQSEIDSTLHAFWDLFAMLADEGATIHVDAGAYPIACWGIERAAARGARVVRFARHDPDALRRHVGREARGGARQVVVTDGFCPGCGRPAPLRDYLDVVRPMEDCSSWMTRRRSGSSGGAASLPRRTDRAAAGRFASPAQVGRPPWW